MLRVTNNDCTYTIRPGDTQADVCRDFGVTVQALRAVNPGMDWRGGGRVAIPGHECLLPRGTRGRGMRDVNPNSVGMSLVPVGARVKVQIATAGTGLGAGQVASAIAYLTGLYDVSIGNGSVLSILMKRKSTIQYPLSSYAADAVLALTTNAGIPASALTSITAAIYDYGTSTPVVTTPTFNYGAIANTPVNPGDQVKVTLGSVSSFTSALGTNQERGSRIANLLAGTYQVDGVDVNGVGSFGGYVNVLVTATRPTTLANVAADVNRAVSTVYSVSQAAGQIGAQFYSRAPAGSTATPGVRPNAVTDSPMPVLFGSPTAPGAPATPGLLDGLTNALGLNTGIPATGLIVAVVAGIVLLVVMKT